MLRPMPIPDFLRAGTGKWKPEEINRIEEKLDGHRIAIVRHSNRECARDNLQRPAGAPHSKVEVRTRTVGVDLWPQIQEFLPDLAEIALHLPYGTVLDGELYAPGVPATSVKTMINEGDSRLRFTPFAMPVFDFRPQTYVRFEIIEAMLREQGLSLPKSYSSHHLPLVGRISRQEGTRFLQEEALRMGMEGFVLKRYHYEGWYKVKPKRTVDAVVMGTTVSTSDTHWGTLRAIQVGVYFEGGLLQIASVGSGFQQEYRHSLDTDAKRAALIGRICEVEYDDLAANGKLKFPRFLRWRDDEKTLAECTSDQIEGASDGKPT